LKGETFFEGEGEFCYTQKAVLFKEGVLLFGVSALVPGWLTFKGTGAFLFPLTAGSVVSAKTCQEGFA